MARQTIYDAGGNLSTIDGILKDDHVMDKIIQVQNTATYLLSKLGKQKTTAGRKFILSIQLGVGEGQGNADENAELPDEGAGEFKQPEGNVRYQYGALYISGPAIEATETGKASYVPALKQALKDCRDGFKLNTQRMAHGDGSGVIGKVDGTVTNSVTVPVTAPYGLSYIEADLDNSEKTRLYRRNMMVYFGTAAVARKVVGISRANGTITVDTAVTLTDGETIVRGDSSAKTSAGKEYRGLSEVLKQTGDYLGITRDDIPEWQANQIDIDEAGAGGDISEDYMQQALDTASIYGTDDPDIVITDVKTRRSFTALLTAQKRIVSPMKLEGGFDAIEYNGYGITTDKDAPPQRMRILRLEDFTWMVMKDIGWVNRDGTILKPVEKKDAYRGYLAAYRDIVCMKPANQTEIINITG